MKVKAPRKTTKMVFFLALLLILLALVIYYFTAVEDTQSRDEFQRPEVVHRPDPSPQRIDHSDPVYYPTDSWQVFDIRTTYQSGEMLLEIPLLKLKVPVLDGVDDETLKKGVGLYDYSALPSWGNPNVSIAGHRDIYGEEFYYIDKLAPGDRMYLHYQGKLYTYQYVSTTVVERDDWEPIKCGSFSALTLTSCEPIGVANKRMIVVGELIQVELLEQ